MGEIALQLLQAGVYGIPLAFVFIFFKMWSKTVDNDITDIENRHEKDMDQIKETFKSLKCVDVSNQVSELAGEVGIMVKIYKDIMSKQDSDIRDLYKFKDKVSQEIAVVHEKLGTAQRKSLVSCLLLEDQVDQRNIMCEMINSMGHDVTPTKTVDQAISELKKCFYDIAIVDFYLDGETAEDFIEKHKQLNGSSSTKVLIYTGDENVALPVGTQSLAKPFTLQTLQKKIDEIVD